MVAVPELDTGASRDADRTQRIAVIEGAGKSDDADADAGQARILNLCGEWPIRGVSTVTVRPR